MVPQPNAYPTACTRLWNMRPWRASPLLRPADRFLAWLVCGVLLLAAAAFPLAIVVGMHTHDALAESATTAAAQRHQVSATLQDSAPAPSRYDLYPTTPAVWYADGVRHTGTVYAAAGSRKGEVVDIWVNHHGDQTTAPPNPSSVRCDAALVAIFAWATPVLIGALSTVLAAHRIRTRQLDQWDVEWARMHAGS